MNENVNSVLKKWLPSAVAIIVTVAVLFYYIFACGGVKVTNYLALAACVLLSAVVPILNDRFKLGFPVWLVGTLLFHFVISIDSGTILNFFGTILWWDLFSHGLFGLWAAAMCYFLYKRFVGERLNVFVYIVIFLSVMGLAALWEVYEYTAGIVLGDDIQKVQESIDMGKSPLYDTMTDIIIAAAGVAVYYLCLAAAKLLKTKLKTKTE